MAIRIPSGTISHQQYTADTAANALSGLKDCLVNAGWTAVATPGVVVLTFTGVPSDAQTFTTGSITYRFKTTMSAINDVLIGADATACASNLADAINDNTANEGVTYYTGTSANTYVTASAALGVVTITTITTGSSSVGITTASESLSNATLDSGTYRGGGYKIACVKTPAGLQAKLYIYYYASSTTIYYRPLPMDEVGDLGYSDVGTITYGTSSVYEVIACAHQVAHLMSGVYSGNFNFVFSVPYLRVAHQPCVVSAIADSSGLIEITTSTAHGRSTADHIYISEGTISGAYSTLINGYWQITVTGTYTYTLDSSTFPTSGTYDAGSAVAAGGYQVARYILIACGLHIIDGGLRTALTAGNGIHVYFNQYAYKADSSAWGLTVPCKVVGTYVYGSTLNYGNFGDLLEARLWVKPASSSATSVFVGELWTAFVCTDPAPGDTSYSGFMSHNWWCYTNNATLGCLWLATS